MPLPTQTGISETVPASQTPEMDADRTPPPLPPPSKHRPPPIDMDDLPPTPIDRARANLSRRLHVDIVWIEVAEVVLREPNAEDMPCLAGKSVSEELWVNLDEVQWISLSVKGNIHHYIALGDVVIYCDE